MAYFDRWVALMKANDDEAVKKFTSAILGDCSVMSKGDEVIVEQSGARLFVQCVCPQTWRRRLSMAETHPF